MRKRIRFAQITNVAAVSHHGAPPVLGPRIISAGNPRIISAGNFRVIV